MTPTSIALNRFCLGYRPGDEPGRDPRGWLNEQIVRYNPAPPQLDARPFDSDSVVKVAAEFDRNRMAQREANKIGGGAPAKAMEISKEFQRVQRQAYISDVTLRAEIAATSPHSFAERMVHFWSNHFSVAVGKANLPSVLGAFEFGAIRPNITNHFRDLLGAAVLHPAMLIYLDQQRSIGPDSDMATGRNGNKRGGLGLNENLGREILELHTLGVNGGYTQTDVAEVARALTGWTVEGFEIARSGQPMQNGAAFSYDMHEPGTRRIMGVDYRDTGLQQALDIFNDLATHPATAEFIATKLARHFGGDDPPPAMVKRLKRSFLDSDGHLPTIYAAIIESPEAWVEKPLKFRQPFEWLIGAMRAAGAQLLPPRRIASALEQLAQPVWAATSPAGYDDRSASWLAPDALYRRATLIERFTKRGNVDDVRALAQSMFPGALSETTQAAIKGAESNAMALSLLMVSPEMLRR